MTEVGFTYERYRAFLSALRADDRRFRSYDDRVDDGDVLLRHDVDLSPERALEMAQIEAEFDVTSTYFVLCSTPMYNPRSERLRSTLRRIESLGHDVGLHFSTHQYWPEDDPPSTAELTARVEEERSLLSGVVADPIETVSFHIPPEWVLRREFDAFPSTYEPRFFSDIGYVADSNQRWRDNPPVVEQFPARVQVLTHPGLWGPSDATFAERVREAETAVIENVLTYAQKRYLQSDAS